MNKVEQDPVITPRVAHSVLPPDVIKILDIKNVPGNTTTPESNFIPSTANPVFLQNIKQENGKGRWSWLGLICSIVGITYMAAIRGRERISQQFHINPHP